MKAFVKLPDGNWVEIEKIKIKVVTDRQARRTRHNGVGAIYKPSNPEHLRQLALAIEKNENP
jgi:hypothetical protein